MNSNRELIAKELQADIFAITGLKVGKDDPIIAAALIQSRLIKRTAESLYADVSKQLQIETARHVEVINVKINEHVYHVEERIRQLESISKELLHSKEYMLSEITHKSHQHAMESVKNEMIPLLNQYSAYKIYGMAAVIGLVCGSLPIFIYILFRI